MQHASGYEGLLERYQQGDHEAANQLIARTAPLLFRSIRPFVRDAATAEEVLQETWLRIHSSRHTWRAGQPALPWLLAIARYTRIDHLRRHYRRRETSMEELQHDPPVAAHEAKDELAVLLEALPESQREVVLMLKGEGLSLDEVARATGTTVGSVKQKASRAYAKLRTILQKGGA
jgi:RNA polymerase sigma-70 factor, ECF subfamily